MHRRATILVVVPLLSAVMAAARAQDDSEARAGREALRRLGVTYAGLTSVDIESRGSTLDGHHVMYRSCVDATGRFSHEDFHDYGPSSWAWDERPGYFVFSDLREAKVGIAPGTMYQSIEVGDDWRAFPGPEHHDYAPWSMIAAWVRTFESEPLSIVARDGEGRWRVSHEPSGLAIGWSDDGAVRVIERRVGSGARSVALVTEFDGRFADSPWPIPAIVRRTVRASGQADRVVSYTVTAAAWNLDGLEARLRFDPVERRLDRFDAPTGNVYAPSGELLYNKAELDRQLSGLRGGTRQGWIVAMIVAAAIASLVLAWRRRNCWA